MMATLILAVLVWSAAVADAVYQRRLERAGL